MFRALVLRACVSANMLCNRIIKHHHHHPLSASVFFFVFSCYCCVSNYYCEFPRVATENNNQPIWMKVTVCQTGLESPAAIDRHFSLVFVCARVSILCCLVIVVVLLQFMMDRMTLKHPCCEDGI